MYEDLIKQSRELMHKDDEPSIPGFGMLVDKTFMKAITDTLEASDREATCNRLRYIDATRSASELKTRFEDLRNEFCLRCGKYHEAHLGACDGCRWKK